MRSASTLIHYKVWTEKLEQRSAYVVEVRPIGPRTVPCAQSTECQEQLDKQQLPESHGTIREANKPEVRRFRL